MSNHALYIVLALLGLALLATLLACDPWVDGQHRPDNPIVTAPPIPIAPADPSPGEPAGDAELVHQADSTAVPDSLSVPRLVSIAAGDTVDLRIRLAAGSAREFEVLVAIDDTTTVRSTIEQLEFHRGGLTPADLWGTILVQTDQVVAIRARFDTPGYAYLPIPLEGRAAGRALAHVLWQDAHGEQLGLAVVEVRVR